jgi:NlpC/P60 family putative phage cell wall peptidase
MILGDEIVLRARAWLGTPYLHQASCKGAGTDCLGLLRGIWREVYGAEPREVPPYTPDWAEPDGREELLQAAGAILHPCALGGAAPGDVLVFRMRPGAVAKHLGIAGGVGEFPTFIHAYTGHGVVESALTDPWRRKIAARFRFPSGV